MRGNQLALKHGMFAVVGSLPDVAVEVALQFALRPGLDRLRDLRLVEAFALASIHLRRAAQAIEREGLTEHLGSFVSRTAPLVERLERTLHERELERRSARNAGDPDPLERYRSGGGS